MSLMLFMPLSYAQDGIEEIIVTANKRAESVQDIAMNVSVLTEDVIRERGIYRPEDYLRSLAGVSTPGGDVYYTIRGLNTGTAQVTSGTTNTFLDEISGSITNLYDVSRIEVLRGPQGTLYGSNAVGGTIRYIMNKPSFDGFEGNISLEHVDKKLAPNSGSAYNLMLNVPLSDNLAVRAVFTTGDDPGIYQNIATGRKDIGTQEDEEFRLMARYEKGPVTVNAVYLKKDRYDFGQKEKGNADKPGTSDIVDANCAYDAEWYYGDTCTRVYATAGGDMTGYDPQLAFYSFEDEITWVDTEIMTVNIQYDFEKMSAKLIYADYDYKERGISDWSRIDTDDLFKDPLYYYGDDTSETTEFRLSSTTDGPFSWTVGYYETESNSKPNSVTEWEITDAGGLDYLGYMWFSSHTDCTGSMVVMSAAGDGSCYNAALYKSPYGDSTYAPFPAGGNTSGGLVYGSYNYYGYSEEKAVFGQIGYTTGDWTVTVGLRDYELSDGYKGSEYGIFYEDPDNTGCAGDEPVGVTCSEENGTESDNRPKVTLTYEVHDDLTLFAVSSAGYRSGGNNSALPFFCSSDPEAAGFKRRYVSDKADNTEIGIKARGGNYRINATYFWVDWTGIQVTIRPACGWSFTYNGGEAETSGLELDFSYDLTENLALDFAGSWISAEITKDIEAMGASAGARLPNIAEEQMSLGLSYTFEMFSRSTFARVDMNYYGDSYATFAESQEDMSPSYTQMNLNIGMALNDQSRIQFSVSNLTDERTEAFRFSAESPGYRARNYLQWIPPRTWSISYSQDF
jgi:outer membrane receptor protein involved in Fe transport